MMKGIDLSLLEITGLYAAILAILLVAASINVIRNRVKNEVDLGDGGKGVMLRAIRAQGNFIEYVPMALILMLLLELNRESATLLHGLGITLVVGRLLHFYSIVGEKMPPRLAGMLCTFGVLLVGAGMLLRAVL
ncbi:MAG: hypothetical protein CMM48_17615 [Rhodospirillaceae bacterium]|nr:hypothetical protein [Rhodospirillaceae bacterium]|tara:strand:+ start:1195 stop:1596 length:402 start_codon:yes stop_codon:yes gene_type:complete